MPYKFDSDCVYGSDVAIIEGDLTAEDIRELNGIQQRAIAMNGAYGWSGLGLEFVGAIESLQQLDVLPYARTNIACLSELESIVRLYIGSNCVLTSHQAQPSNQNATLR